MSAVGIAVPAAVFVLSCGITYLLYRHFSKEQGRRHAPRGSTNSGSQSETAGGTGR